MCVSLPTTYPKMATFSCNLCEKHFTRKFNLDRHVNSKHSGKKYTCQKCGKSYSSTSYLRRHHCKSSTSIVQSKSAVDEIKIQSETTHNHADVHEKSPAASNIQYLSGTDDEFISLIKNRWSSIRTHFKCRKIDDVLNVRLINQKEDMKKILTSVWVNKLQSQVKLQCSIGCILQKRSTQEFRYFHSYATNSSQLFSSPRHVKSLSDLMKAVDTIMDLDLLEVAKNQRPNSEWIAFEVTNLTFNFSKLPYSKFGSPCTIPHHIKASRSMMTLTNDGHKKYTDNLCFFRALALSQICTCINRCHCLKRIEPTVQHLYDIYTNFKKSNTVSSKYKGVTLKELTTMEKIFQVKITVYELSVDGKASIIRQSHTLHSRALNLCAVNNHFCFIRKLASFSSCYQCSICEQCFKKRQLLTRHKRVCSKNQSKFKFGGDYFHPPLSIFEEIRQQTGINVSKSDRFYPFRATFDIESYLRNVNQPITQTQPKLSIQSEHELMSVAVCSNIPEYSEPVCFVSEGNEDEVVEEFVVYLQEMSDKATSLMLKHYSWLIEKLITFQEHRQLVEDQFKDQNISNPFHYNSRSIKALIEKFYNFISELPVIGFNSQKYDLNVIRAPLVRYLLKHDQIKFTIKRDNSIKCLKTNKLKFLDMLNFIAPGFDYSTFIKAYGCEMTKGFFPYEYVTSLNHLKEKELPPHESFFSSLRQENISEENYRYCQKVWEKNRMETMLDFLKWYNCLDVVPFLEAIQKQSDVYKLHGIDMLKDGVSVPGLATKWLFQISDTDQFSIPLITRKHEDLYHTIRKNIVGGPSIIFHRKHIANETKIRFPEYKECAETCKKIYGYDANALYLWCTMQPLPTGPMIRRKADNHFLPQFSDIHGRMSLEWMSYLTKLQSIHIEHKFNVGEKKVGQHGIPVDGFCEATNTVYQFHGCLFHGCPLKDCNIVKNRTHNPVNGKLLTVLQKDTVLKEEYIKKLGFHLVTIYECRWQEFKKESQTCRSFIKQWFSEKMAEKSPMTENEIIDAVKNDVFYGLVECDLHTPDHLRNYFAEMQPIFKHSLISRTDLPPTMLDYATKHNILRSPQKSLIGSYFGEKVLVLSTLLKWYLEKGLVISKIYQIVQFTPFSCFSHFGEAVCDARRAGDIDSSKKLISETAKLSGNVIYGTTITNKERFTDVKYVNTPEKASQLVNSKRFMSAAELADDIYEVQLSKSKINLDTPIIIGFAILQLAKLRMLQFYYDVIDAFIPRCKYQYCAMDTDSAYFATSGYIEDIIIDSKRKEFFSQFDKWFIPPFCDKHKSEFVYAKTHKLVWRMRPCCRDSEIYHRRTPGLFKPEFNGEGIIALNSKTYFCFGEGKTKSSTKGLMNRLNPLEKEDFLKVLENKTIVSGRNRGIMRKNQKMVTYSQVRAGLNYFYAKRKVHPDGVSTSPLSL